MPGGILRIFNADIDFTGYNIGKLGEMGDRLYWGIDQISIFHNMEEKKDPGSPVSTIRFIPTSPKYSKSPPPASDLHAE